jgi:hypothetical protein
MSALADYPTLRGLLVEMLALVELDTQLPLTILINLHRRELRAPLENIERLLPEVYDEQTASGLQPVQEMMRQRWPGIRGKLYDTSARLVKLASDLAWSEREVGPEELAGYAPSPLVRRMLEHSRGDWYPYETPALLHRLTWAGADLSVMSLMLEIELGLSPEVRQMLLELTRPVQSE